MTTILHPTRGGAASYPNQDGAIRLAKEREAALVFLYVSDVQFLGQAASPIPVDIEQELEHLGEFVLAMAQERAQREGIEAQALVKQGEFEEALRTAINEIKPEVVMFGSPGENTATLTRLYLEELAAGLSDELGIEVFFLRDGEILSHIPAKTG